MSACAKSKRWAHDDDVDTSPPTLQPIKAVPLRHPWRWIAAVVIVILVGLFLYGAATNDAYGWDVFAEYLFDERIFDGLSTPCS